MRTRAFARLVGAGLALGLLSSLPTRGAAQDTVSIQRQIEESRRRLEQVREERARLQEDMAALRTRVRDASRELVNIEQQLSASRSVMAELDFQIETTQGQVEETTTAINGTRASLAHRTDRLNGRLRAIYKRGPLHSVRVLLGAESFADLLNRYRYLALVARHDRTLLTGVRELEEELVSRNRELQENLAEMNRLRDDQLAEVAALQRVERQRQRTLEQIQTEEVRTQDRIAALESDEQRLSTLIGDLDQRRLSRSSAAAGAGGAGGAPGAVALEPASLEWPVDGKIIYPFGRQRQPNGTVLRWNGIGISAPAGSPVRAVRPGVVVLAGPFEGYGPTVVVSHGDGLYSLYLYLDEIGVVEGRTVSEGQVVGTVGGGETPEGAHIEFQIRAPVEGRAPQAVDPLLWLRPRPPG